MSIRMSTYTGKTIDLQALKTKDIAIEDIAHGLSNCCRYVGQCSEFYSVAEHSYRMAQYLEAQGRKKPLCLLALLHDASEAYLGDLHTDLKAILPEYKALEKQVMSLILRRYNCWSAPTSDYMKIVKDLDIKIRTAEVEYLLTGVDAFSWKLVPFDYKIVSTASPGKAESEFLKMFDKLRS